MYLWWKAKMEETKPIIKSDLEDSEDKKDTLVNGYGGLSKHIKRRVLLELEQYGCTSQTLQIAAAVRRTDDTKSIKGLYISNSGTLNLSSDYIINSCSKAEENVDQECNSVSLNNINKWLELMKETDLFTLCEYEAAVVMNSIVRNEQQPKPDLLNGINMTEVYKFLENALIGQPQKGLSKPSQAFLFREIGQLITEANSDQSDVEARRMGQTLYNCQDYNYMADPPKASLDPLFLDKS